MNVDILQNNKYLIVLEKTKHIRQEHLQCLDLKGKEQLQRVWAQISTRISFFDNGLQKDSKLMEQMIPVKKVKLMKHKIRQKM